MVWTFLMHTNNSNNEEKFLHIGCWPLKENRQGKEDMDWSNNDRSKEVQLIQRFGPRCAEMAKKNSRS